MPKSADSDSVTGQDDPSWTLLDRGGLVDAYRDVVAPAMRADGLDSPARCGSNGLRIPAERCSARSLG